MKIKEEIETSVALLKKGKVLLYPTDTIWGIGCDATNAKAVQRVFKIKERDESKNMILLLDDAEKLSDYIESVPPIAYDLIKNSAAPLTIVYSGAKNLAKKLIASDGTIAIRIVSGPYCSAIIEGLGKPIVSTSANISGQPTATTFDQISDAIKEKVDHVASVFQDRLRAVKPSTIIKLEENGVFTVLRS